MESARLPLRLPSRTSNSNRASYRRFIWSGWQVQVAVGLSGLKLVGVLHCSPAMNRVWCRVSVAAPPPPPVFVLVLEHAASAPPPAVAAAPSAAAPTMTWRRVGCSFEDMSTPEGCAAPV